MGNTYTKGPEMRESDIFLHSAQQDHRGRLEEEHGERDISVTRHLWQVTRREQVVEPGFEPVTLYETRAFSPLPLPTTHFSLMLNMAAGLHDPCPCKQGLEEDTRRVQRKRGHRRHTQLIAFSSSFFLKGLPRSFTQDPHSCCMLGLS